MATKRRGDPRKRGGQPKNANALTHGYYARPVKPIETLDDLIADLRTKQTTVSNLIETALQTAQADNETLIKLFALHAQTANRIGRLLRDQRALSGKSADGIAAAFAAALDEIHTELGYDV